MITVQDPEQYRKVVFLYFRQAMAADIISWLLEIPVGEVNMVIVQEMDNIAEVRALEERDLRPNIKRIA